MSTYIDEVFGSEGVLARAFDNYQFRPGQVEMARAFDRAIRDNRHLLAEGPTGVGKSFAYLVPSIYNLAEWRKLAAPADDPSEGDERVVVATANIALQEQLASKDLPTLQKLLPVEFTFGVLKGRNNYLCKDAIDDVFREADMYLSEEDTQVLRQIAKWSNDTATGDKSEIDFDVKGPIWGRVSRTFDTCLGRQCPYYRDCFGTVAQNSARRQDVVVMNYHIRLIGGGFAKITPAHRFMVCDEAHDIPKIARDLFGWTLSATTINRVAAWVEKRRRSTAQDIGRRLRAEAAQLFNTVILELGDKKNTKTLRDPGWYDAERLAAALQDAADLAADVALDAEESVDEASGSSGKIDAIRAAARAKKVQENAVKAKAELNMAVELEKDDWVYWLERLRRQNHDRITIEGRPLLVDEALNKALFSRATVGALSATMTAGGSFDFVREQLGVPDEAGEVIAPSPFDLRKQGVIFVPEDMPSPPVGKSWGDKGVEQVYLDALVEYTKWLIEQCGGRCLCLFTSWKNLNHVYWAIKKMDLGVTLLRQGDIPSNIQLLEQFKQNETSVLFGVASFWQGVDVPGNSLVGLIIDKVPFPVPYTPVNAALNEYYESHGRNAFFELSLPSAIIQLRQGIGRLIRTKEDIGIALILDSRIHEKGYGDTIMESLPEMRKIRRSPESITDLLRSL